MRRIAILFVGAIGLSALLFLGGCTQAQIDRAAAISAGADARLAQADQAMVLAQAAVDQGKALAEQLGSIRAEQVVAQAQQALVAAGAAREAAKLAADAGHAALSSAQAAQAAGGSTLDVLGAALAAFLPTAGIAYAAIRRAIAAAQSLRQVVAGVEDAKEKLPDDQVVKLHASLDAAQDEATKRRVALVRATLASLLLCVCFLGSASAVELGLGFSPISGSATVDSTAIVDGAIVNADINSAAAIAGSKIASVGRILASSVTAVSHTGDTAEFTFATYSLPANTLAQHGRLSVISLWSTTGSVNNKTLRVKLGSTAFLAFVQTGGTSTSYYRTTDIFARTTASEISLVGTAGSGVGGQAGTTTGTEDLTTTLSLTLTGQLASSGENVTLEGYQILVFNP